MDVHVGVSKETIDKAIAEIEPYAIVAMISGGKDSLAAYLVAKELGVKITHIVHGVTGTGIPETTRFVREFSADQTPVYLEASAGDAYADYLNRKGFMGIGNHAHNFSYHILKRQRFATAISRNIRLGQRLRPIILINGARMAESGTRRRKLNAVVRKDGPNYWVNILHGWTKEERDDYLDRANAPCNPVTAKLCRSGECMCGTMQSKADREEAAFYFPSWGTWLDELEKPIKARFGWGWGDAVPTWHTQEKAGQLRLFQPMCIDCLTPETNLTED